MITEDYVSFEIAKLLKEKGFDGPCYKVWESHGESPTLVGAPWFVEGETVVNRELVDAAAKQYAYEYDLSNKVEGYLAPTLQMAMKWLREVHSLNVYVRAVWKDVEIQYGNWEESVVGYDWFIENLSHNSHLKTSTEESFRTYEEACEVAIKYCLKNLI